MRSILCHTHRANKLILARPDEPAEIRIGVDVGGTFTDLVAYRRPASPHRQDPIHPAELSGGRDRGGQARATACGHPPEQIIHGSTVATNALLQRTGEPVAFVTTAGFRDMLLIGRQNRPSLYSLRIVRPEPLAKVENCFTVQERIGPEGEIIEPLEAAAIDRLLQEIQSRGLRHVAVCLLFSFINPVHEKLIAERCRAAGLTVSLSSEIMPEFREYERASTTVINASLRPTVETYLRLLETGLRRILASQ